jgi:bifunctional non-homologous end joining protein LigD
VKTTGGKGLHVVAPIARHRDWPECLAFTKAVAEALAHSDRIYTTAFAKKGRESKILVDYLRNNRTNTTVAAFSARARDGATVSMPVSWHDLDKNLEPGAYTVLTVPKMHGPDPWREYWKSRQKISARVLTAIQRMAA